MTPLSRRNWLATAGLAALSSTAPLPKGNAAVRKDRPFGYMLNTATIMGQKLDVAKQIEIAAAAGYDAIEPWIRDLEAYGQPAELAKRIRDKGLTVESAIGFAPWIVADEAARKKGLEQAKRDMELVLAIGGQRIAAPPVGATAERLMDLRAVADRYAQLCELGAKMGVIPQVELWGHSQTLQRLGETALVAIESGHPQACILADVFHLYKGGTGLRGMKWLNGATMHVFHMNDYPDMKPSEIRDEHRVYPGDGVADLTGLLRDLHASGFRGLLSLELFNRTYWKQDPLEVAKTGLAKMKGVVDKAMRRS
ncbi:MAG: sugar phosphate isomerase/epimerase family protein [Gemmataceae bacterium]